MKDEASDLAPTMKFDPLDIEGKVLEGMITADGSNLVSNDEGQNL